MAVIATVVVPPVTTVKTKVKGMEEIKRMIQMMTKRARENLHRGLLLRKMKGRTNEGELHRRLVVGVEVQEVAVMKQGPRR